jgi:hypothetical protein
MRVALKVIIREGSGDAETAWVLESGPALEADRDLAVAAQLAVGVLA